MILTDNNFYRVPESNIQRVTVKTFRNDEPYRGNLFEDHPELVDSYPSIKVVSEKVMKLNINPSNHNQFFILAVHEKNFKDLEVFKVDELFDFHEIINLNKNFREELRKLTEQK
jgi:hypothetical protein